MSPRVARLPRLATLSNSSDLKWWGIVSPGDLPLADATHLPKPNFILTPAPIFCFSTDTRRRPPQLSPDNSLSQSVLYQSERSFTSLNDTSFTLNSSGYVDSSFNTDRSGAFSPLCKCTHGMSAVTQSTTSLPTHPRPCSSQRLFTTPPSKARKISTGFWMRRSGATRVRRAILQTANASTPGIFVAIPQTRHASTSIQQSVPPSCRGIPLSSEGLTRPPSGPCLS
jgi:hypothetical protein